MTKKLNNKKGFTLAELLVVVAIIAVLVAVSIPIFSAQTKKANLATNQANARAAKAAAVSQVLGGNTAGVYKYDIATGTIVANTDTSTGTDVAQPIDPSEWTVSNQDALTTTTYKTWYVTVATKDDTTNKITAGQVTKYGYADPKN